MKLSAWAKRNGLSYNTAYRLWRSGKLPIPAEQLETGTILVHEPEIRPAQRRAVLYARVSSHDQKADLERQLQRLRDFAASSGIPVAQEVKEIASGLNAKRKKLSKLLKDPTVSPIIIEHRDRLARFGVEMIEDVLTSAGRILQVLNQEEYRDDLVQDFVDLTTSLCAKIYGRRSARNRARRALAATKD